MLIRLTDQERDALASRAAAQGISVQRYLLECAAALETGAGVLETRTQRQELVKEMFALRRLLANVANNVNQIAKAANSGELVGVQRQALETFEAARRTSDRIYDLVDGMLPKRRGL